MFATSSPAINTIHMQPNHIKNETLDRPTVQHICHEECHRNKKQKKEWRCDLDPTQK